MALEESFYDEVKRIILEINNITGCSNCGGNFEESACIYCETKDNNLDVLIVRLKEKLEELNNFLKENDINKLTVNRLFNLLFSVSCTKISDIDRLLEKYNYNNLFNEFYTQTLDRLRNNEELSVLEINILEAIIDKNSKEYNYTELFMLLTKRCIEKRNNISLQSFVKLTMIFTNSLIKNEYPNPKCFLLQDDETKENLIVHGSSVFNTINLREADIISLYENGEVDIIDTIFHEFTHTVQYSKIFRANGIVDPLTLLELKDYILSKENIEYYNNNYKNISYEKEAEWGGLYFSNLFLKTIGHSKNEEVPSNEALLPYFLDSNRVENGILRDIEDIFDEYIRLKPELLTKYPQLKIMYLIENNEVRRNTQLRSKEDYNQVKMKT